MSATASERGFEIGRVIQDAAGAVRHNAVSFLVLTLALNGIPFALYGLAGFKVIAANAGLTPGAPPDLSGLGPAMSLFAVGGLLSVLANAIQQGAVIFGTAAYLNGRPVSLGDCFGAGLRRCLPLIGLNIVMAIAIFVGLIFFIAPGLMMAVAWIAATPVLVVERTGVFGAFGRSADLTRGRRWPLFGLGFLFFVAIGVVQQVLLSVVRVGVPAINPMAMIATQLPVSGLFSLVVSVVSPAMVAAAYYELRRTREGVGPEALAAVFD